MLETADYLQLAASFVLVVVMLYSFYYLFNRYGIGFGPQKRGEIEIIEIKHLGKNKGLLLVRTQGSLFLLVFDEAGIRPIREWNGKASYQDTVEPGGPKSDG